MFFCYNKNVKFCKYWKGYDVMKRIIALCVVCLLLCGCTKTTSDISSNFQNVSDVVTNITNTSDISDILSISSDITEIISSEENITNNNTSVNSNTSTTTSIESSMPVDSSTITEPSQETVDESQIFADIFRTDYVYDQDEYWCVGQKVYSNVSGSDITIYDTVTKTYQQIQVGGYGSVSGICVYNGYLTAYMCDNYAYLDKDRILIYNLTTGEKTVIDGVSSYGHSFVYGDYIYVKFAYDSPAGGQLKRTLINASERKWETVVSGDCAEYTTVGKYLFGNRNDSTQMYRVDLSNGEVLDYTNGLIFEKIGQLQNDNWIMTNKGVFDVASNSIKYPDEVYSAYGNTGVKIRFELYTATVDFLNFETGERMTKTITLDEVIPPVIESKTFDIWGCTYNGVYNNNIFFRFINREGSIEFEKIICTRDFYQVGFTYSNTHSYGCLFILNDYYFYVDLDRVYKAPLNDINNKTSLLK